MIRHLLHPIRTARRMLELGERLRCLQHTLEQDGQWLAHDNTARALTDRYRAMAGEDWGSYAPEDISSLRDNLGLNPYGQAEEGRADG